MTIKVGDKLPDATFKSLGTNGPEDISVTDFFAGKTVVAFAVPGAFTPTCHMTHLPSYLERADDLRAKGVSDIACIAVNDIFVLDAWAKASNAKGKITFLSDGNATFTKQLGLELDGSAFGMGIRSQRYAMVVQDGVVMSLHIEESPSETLVSTAECMLPELQASVE